MGSASSRCLRNWEFAGQCLDGRAATALVFAALVRAGRTRGARTRRHWDPVVSEWRVAAACRAGSAGAVRAGIWREASLPGGPGRNAAGRRDSRGTDERGGPSALRYPGRLCAARPAPPRATHQPDLIERVRAALAAALTEGDARIGQVAQRLGMGRRALQEGLTSHGSAYQRVLKETRQALACEHLTRPDLSAPGVALLPGYSDATAFHCAIRRWTGMTPGAYRRTIRHPLQLCAERIGLAP